MNARPNVSIRMYTYSSFEFRPGSNFECGSRQGRCSYTAAHPPSAASSTINRLPSFGTSGVMRSLVQPWYIIMDNIIMSFFMNKSRIIVCYILCSQVVTYHPGLYGLQTWRFQYLIIIITT